MKECELNYNLIKRLGKFLKVNNYKYDFFCWYIDDVINFIFYKQLMVSYNLLWMIGIYVNIKIEVKCMISIFYLNIFIIEE